jgi:CBS domain-containing protein
MNVKIHELMTESVVSTEPHKSIDHVRRMMERNRVGAIPVIDSQGRPVGIVSSTDIVADTNGRSPVSTIMTEKVYSVPKYDDVSTAARVMRNHRIHRVLVTHEQRVVGVLSTFDLLKLVEGRRYVDRNAPTESKRRGSRKS